MARFWKYCCILLISIFSVSVYAQTEVVDTEKGTAAVVTEASEKEIKGRSIMKAVIEQSRIHKTQRIDVLMEIQDKSKRVRIRNFTSIKKINELKKIQDIETRSLIKFYKPNKIKGTSLLTHSKESESKNQQWMYFPAMKSVKRLSSSGKNNSFMGSDFTYSDIAGRQLEQDKHTLVKEDEKYFYVRSIPIKKEEGDYRRMDFVIDKKMTVPRQITFYDGKDKKLKTLLNRKVKQVKGMYLVVDSVMKNAQTGGQTRLEVGEIEVGIKLSDIEVGHKGLKTI